MERALEEARVALATGEVPVGCVALREGVVVARAHNRTNELHDPLAHAEFLVVRALEEAGADTAGLTFYITVEPCVMCHGVLSRIGARVFFGCFNEVFGTRCITGGCAGTHLADSRCVDILREFYLRENLQAPPEKRSDKTHRSFKPFGSDG